GENGWMKKKMRRIGGEENNHENSRNERTRILVAIFDSCTHPFCRCPADRKGIRTMAMIRKMNPHRYPPKHRKEITESDFKNSLEDVIDGIAARVRNRITRHPETAADPRLCNEQSALTFEALAKQIRAGD